MLLIRLCASTEFSPFLREVSEPTCKIPCHVVYLKSCFSFNLVFDILPPSKNALGTLTQFLRSRAKFNRLKVVFLLVFFKSMKKWFFFIPSELLSKKKTKNNIVNPKNLQRSSVGILFNWLLFLRTLSQYCILAGLLCYFRPNHPGLEFQRN